MRNLLLFLFLYGLNPLLAQTSLQRKNLEVGDEIFIKPCKSGQKEILSMDIYSRTKPYNKKKVNKATGEGFFDEFFNDKSIDAKPLPCIMSGKKYKVAALQEFNVNGNIKRVVLCYSGYDLTIIWIEFDQALLNGEISF
jgi:hypothetical protein